MLLDWLNDQLNNHRFFRRLIIVYFCALSWANSYWAFDYAKTSELSGSEVALVIGSIQGLISIFLGYVYKIYSRSADSKN